MCGICGLIGEGGLSEAAVEALQKSLGHRGPDAADVRRAGNACLVHTRLSIIDLSEAGRQPMPNEDETLWLVFNGEIYNAPALRERLLKQGHTFRSTTDSEVLLHLYEEEGPAMVEKLRGMFAFVLYDVEKDEAFAARDPFGIKPFFYKEHGGRFGFASELRALLALPDFPRVMDWEAFGLYARLNYVPAPRTMWAHARRLEPGHWLLVREGRVARKERYFTLEKNGGFAGGFDDGVDALDRTLRQSVRAHLLSDVPVGAFLSGGLDSSIVAAMAQRELDTKLNTFTVTFPDLHVFDESGFARQVAEHIGSNHEAIPVSGTDARAALFEMLDHLDEPFADSSLVPAAIVSKATSRRMKVALAGDGGDELFAGYNKYQGLRLAERFGALRPLLQAVARLPLPEHHGSLFGKRWRQVRKLARVMAPTAFERYLRATELVGDPVVGAVNGHRGTARHLAEGASQARVEAQLRQVWQRGQARGFREADLWLYADAQFGLAYDMLHKVDVASMRYSLEVREPFIDPEVARLAFGFPPEWKLRGNERKHILKKVSERYLPASVVHRSKQGFGFPIGEWARGELRPLFEEVLAPERLAQSGIWDPAAVQRLFDEHLSRKKDRYRELWNILVFEKWRQQWQPDLQTEAA